MILILDASMALAWLLERKDQREAALAADALDVVRAAGTIVPALWFAEVANALLLAERQRVITAQESAVYLAELSLWEIVQDSFSPASSLANSIQLGRIQAHRLRRHLPELAMRRAATLATFDSKLAAAARAAGVRVFGDPA